MSSSVSSNIAVATKPPRILACVLCQSRKVRCDRNFPCSNCTKAGARCVPAGSIKKERRKRFPERELLDRLRRYEGLLRQNGIDFDPLHSSSTVEQTGLTSEAVDSELHAKVQAIDLGEQGVVEAEEMPSFKAINIWHAMNNRSQSPSSENESDIEDIEVEDNSIRSIHQKSVKKALSHVFEDDDDGRFNFGPRSDVDLVALHPTQLDIFRIWQIYLDRVNPLLKITHTPTLQTQIVEAIADIPNINPALQALMFGIYCVTMLSLEDGECMDLFGSKCGDLLQNYQLGCRQAMLRCKILRTNDRHCLTAFFLYLLSTKPRSEPRTLSANLAIAIRIAQYMGIHSEAMNSKHPALEAEMRRRLWWSIVHLETRTSEMTDFKCPILAPVWDCKPPSNVNDFELTADMTNPPSRHVGVTEAVFMVARSELSDFVRFSDYWLSFTNPCLKPLAHRRPDKSASSGDGLDLLEKVVEERYLKFCNPESPLHLMTIWMARSHMAKQRLLAHYSRHAHAPAKQTEVERDLALGFALSFLESDTELITSPITKIFHWMSMTILQFPFMAYIHAVQDLNRRPLGKLASRAWTAMSENYAVRFTNWIGDVNPLVNILSKSVLRAWAARQASLDTSETEVVPSIVEVMKRRQADSTSTSSEAQSPNLPSWIQQTMTNTDSWMPIPMTNPLPMSMDFNQFDQGYGSAWSGLLPTMTGPIIEDIPMEQADWGNLDWSSMRNEQIDGRAW